MDSKSLLLVLGATAAWSLSVFLFVRSGYKPLWRLLLQATQGDSSKFKSWVDELFVDWSREQATLTAVTARFAIIVSALVTFLFTRSYIFAAIAGIVVYCLPSFLFQTAMASRLKRFEEQLPDAVDLMVSSVRAGNALSSAIEDVWKRMSGPVSQEFGIIAREHMVGGISVEDSLARARSRLKVESFTMISSALIISLAQGGDLLHILERMSEATRSLLKLQKKIVTETSEVRAQEKIILIMTPLFGVVVCLFDPAIPDILFHSLLGNLLLAVVVGMQAVCVVWIRSIVKATI